MSTAFLIVAALFAAIVGIAILCIAMSRTMERIDEPLFPDERPESC